MPSRPSASSLSEPPAVDIDQIKKEMTQEILVEGGAGSVRYQGFGSFHSGNVEELMSATAEEYVPPADFPEFAHELKLPAGMKKYLTTVSQPSTNGTDAAGGQQVRTVQLPYGRALKSSHAHSSDGLFSVDPTWTFINHGAFGGALAPAVAMKHLFESQMEKQMLRFVDRQLLPWLVYSTRCLASFLNCRPVDLTLVPNATHGINAAIPSLVTSSSDLVVFLDCEYGAVFKALKARCDDVKAQIYEIDVNFLLSQQPSYSHHHHHGGTNHPSVHPTSPNGGLNGNGVNGHGEAKITDSPQQRPSSLPPSGGSLSQLFGSIDDMLSPMISTTTDGGNGGHFPTSGGLGATAGGIAGFMNAHHPSTPTAPAPIPPPTAMLNDDDFTAYIESKLPPNTTVFVCDHITSNTATLLPVFTHIVPMLRRKGVKKIIIDGAHAPLQVPLDFLSLKEEERPTVYLGNLHKWFSAPKAVGFLWVDPALTDYFTSTTVGSSSLSASLSSANVTMESSAEQALQRQKVLQDRVGDIQPIRSRIVSHGSGNGFHSEFIWDGTRDYSAALTIPALVRFWRDTVGVESVRKYCSQLLHDAEVMLTTAFHVVPVARRAPFMCLIRLPLCIRHRFMTPKYLQDTLYHRFRIEVPVKEIEKKLYIRLTAFVYNDMAEYIRVRDAILTIAAVASLKRVPSTPTTSVVPPASLLPAAGASALEEDDITASASVSLNHSFNRPPDGMTAHGGGSHEDLLLSHANSDHQKFSTTAAAASIDDALVPNDRKRSRAASQDGDHDATADHVHPHVAPLLPIPTADSSKKKTKKPCSEKVKKRGGCGVEMLSKRPPGFGDESSSSSDEEGIRAN